MHPEIVQAVVLKHMRRQYGTMRWLESIIADKIIEGLDRTELFKYLWINTSGGDAANNTTNAIFDELGLE